MFALLDNANLGLVGVEPFDANCVGNDLGVHIARQVGQFDRERMARHPEVKRLRGIGQISQLLPGRARASEADRRHGFVDNRDSC